MGSVEHNTPSQEEIASDPESSSRFVLFSSNHRIQKTVNSDLSHA
jgi:hypothetical protein